MKDGYAFNIYICVCDCIKLIAIVKELVREHFCLAKLTWDLFFCEGAEFCNHSPRGWSLEFAYIGSGLSLMKWSSKRGVSFIIGSEVFR